MKYLLVLFVVMVAIFIWRGNRVDKSAKPRRGATQREDDAVDILSCDVCGLHCPRSDMVVGRNGMYCSAQHRSQSEA